MEGENLRLDLPGEADNKPQLPGAAPHSNQQTGSQHDKPTDFKGRYMNICKDQLVYIKLESITTYGNSSINA